MIHPEDVEGWHQVNARLVSGEFDKYIYNVRISMGGKDYEWWEIRFTCLRSLDPSEVPLIFGLCSNVEKSVQTLKTLEQARDKAQMSEKLKSAFLANMSHEIRTPLNAIVGFANVLTSSDEFEKEERQVFIETIRNNCNLLLALISDVLDLAQIESGSMHYKEEACDVNEFIAQIVTTQRMIIPGHLQLISDVPDETTYIVIDKLRLNQVITNLINNAVKFTKKGSVTVGYLNENDGWLHFFVEDTGRGIPEKDIENIFQRFFKKDDFAQGAGLGLSISKMIVDHYEGEIHVTSKEGVGSRFTVSIPYVNANTNEIEIRTKKDNKNINNLFSMNTTNDSQLSQDRVTLLIADDEDSNYLLLKTVLQKHCNLIRAKTGIEALDLFKANQADIDLIMLDIKMPEMTGIEALKEIRKLEQDIPIIMQSAYVFDTDMEAARQAGATDFITKPINLKILKATISKFCPSVQWG
jgi:signal transduction histidine kinase/CheY-like chemotaxis protein